MARDDSFHDYIISEVFRGIEGIASRSMFGGWGIYKEGVFFALISSGQLYFKVDASNQPYFKSHGSKPFVYSGHKGRDVTLSYWELPVEVMDDQDELIKWVDKSVEAAKKSKKK